MSSSCYDAGKPMHLQGPSTAVGNQADLQMQHMR